MARPPRPEQLAALARIRECMAEHGEEVGSRLARADFPAIDKGTWSRWCKQVREENALFEAAPVVADAPDTRKATPLEPAEVCEAAPGVIDFHGQLGIMLHDCDLVRDYAAPVDPATGRRKVRNPLMLTQAVKLRATVMALAQRHAEAAWDIERIRRMQEDLISTIAGALKDAGDKELTEGILRALRDTMDRQKSRERYLGAPGQLENAA